MSRPSIRTCPRGRRAGFTLVESMVVVVMVGILVAAAIPTISLQLKSRRTGQAASMIAQVYRSARTLAMGRGSAVLVRYTSATQGSFEIREAVGSNKNTGYCAVLPSVLSSSCLSTDWDTSAVNTGSTTVTSSPQYRVVSSSSFYVSGNSVYSHVTATASIAGSSPTTLDICFTPLGRAWYRTTTGTGQPFTLLSTQGVATVSVTSSNGGFTRLVLIPASGFARLGA